jgi:hypothetical protein
VVEGNPLAAGGWAPGRTLIGSGGLYAVACPLKTRCVAIDGIGNAFTGAGDGQPPYPYLLHAPTIVGTALQGQWLNVRRGIWSPGALTYRYQWERCNTPDGSCLPIRGATGTRYRLTALDTFVRLRVIETAAGSAGAGPPAVSGATGVVSALGAEIIDSATTAGTSARIRIECLGRAPTLCPTTFTMTVTETLRKGKIVAVSARRARRVKTTRKVVVVGTGAATLSGGRTTSVRLNLNHTGRRLLSARHRLPAAVAAFVAGTRQDEAAVTFVGRRQRR